VLKRTFGPKRDEATRGRRRLHEDFHNLYLSKFVYDDKSCDTRWAGHGAHIGEKMYKTLVRKFELKRVLGKPEDV
jgi:hypothetical protein